MNKGVKKMLLFPITLLSIIIMIAGALCLGYSGVILIFNGDYIETESTVVKVTDESTGKEKEVLEYVVDEQTYQASFPFIKLKIGSKVTIGYNPKSPTRFHLGNHKSHMALLIWGIFFLILGLTMMFSIKGLGTL